MKIFSAIVFFILAFVILMSYAYMIVKIICVMKKFLN